MRGMRWILAATALCAHVGAAEAVCPGLDVLFEDNFETLQPTWGEADDRFRAANGALIVSPVSGTDTWRENSSGLYDDVEYCVNVTVVTAVDETEAKAGAVFWYEDVNNFYVFQIAPNRMASVWRRQRGQWLEQIGWQRLEAANEGEGAVNELRVTTVGDEASFFINGTEFGQVTGSAPENGQQIGVLAASPVAGAATYTFDALKVTSP